MAKLSPGLQPGTAPVFLNMLFPFTTRIFSISNLSNSNREKFILSRLWHLTRLVHWSHEGDQLGVDFVLHLPPFGCPGVHLLLELGPQLPKLVLAALFYQIPLQVVIKVVIEHNLLPHLPPVHAASTLLLFTSLGT